jgi:hypothetical protein
MLAGHAWMCWNGQMPLRALLWDEKLASGLVETLFGMDWDAWVSSMDVDAGINRAIRVQATFFLASAIAFVLPLHRRFIAGLGVLVSADLVFLSWLKYHDSGLGIGHLFEHASQFLLPVLVALSLYRKPWVLLAQGGLAATFVGHGISAIGFGSQNPWWNHPRPGNFMEMTMACLRLGSEQSAARVLVGAGIVDFVAVVLIFLRGWPRVVGLCYMVAWGFLTALARPWFYFEPAAAAETLLRWVPEFLFRVPHFGLPLCLLLLVLRPKVTHVSDPL